MSESLLERVVDELHEKPGMHTCHFPFGPCRCYEETAQRIIDAVLTEAAEELPGGLLSGIALSERRARGIVARLREESGDRYDSDAYALEEAVNDAYGDRIEDLGDQAYAILSCNHAVPLWDNKPHPKVGEKMACERSARCRQMTWRVKVVALVGKTMQVGRKAYFRRVNEQNKRALSHVDYTEFERW